MQPEPLPLEIRIEEHEQAVVVIIDGQIDLYNDRVLGDALDRLFDRGHNQLALDMSAVPFVDSAGFGLLIAAQKRFNERGGRIHYSNVPKNVESVVKLSRLQDFIRIYPSRAAALEAFAARHKRPGESSSDRSNEPSNDSSKDSSNDPPNCQRLT